jgi:hypothetical protein
MAGAIYHMTLSELLDQRCNRLFEAGNWFWLPATDLGLAPFVGPLRPGGGHKAVILGYLDPHRPVAHGCIRTPEGHGGLGHPAHPRDGRHPVCRLVKPGSITIHPPLTFKQELLTDDSFMCQEPDRDLIRMVEGEGRNASA